MTVDRTVCYVCGQAKDGHTEAEIRMGCKRHCDESCGDGCDTRGLLLVPGINRSVEHDEQLAEAALRVQTGQFYDDQEPAF